MDLGTRKPPPRGEARVGLLRFEATQCYTCLFAGVLVLSDCVEDRGTNAGMRKLASILKKVATTTLLVQDPEDWTFWCKTCKLEPGQNLPLPAIALAIWHSSFCSRKTL